SWSMAAVCLPAASPFVRPTCYPATGTASQAFHSRSPRHPARLAGHRNGRTSADRLRALARLHVGTPRRHVRQGGLGPAALLIPGLPLTKNIASRTQGHGPPNGLNRRPVQDKEAVLMDITKARCRAHSFPFLLGLSAFVAAVLTFGAHIAAAQTADTDGD